MDTLEPQLTVDPEGVTDHPRNSIFVGLAGVTGVLGLLATIEPLFAILSFASIVFSLVVLVFAHRWELAPLSVRLARLCFLAGLFCTLAGGANHWVREQLLHRKATEIAGQYLAALSNDDRATAISMVGLPPLIEEEGATGEGKVSKEQLAVREFMRDPANLAVIESGKEAQWRATRIVSKQRTGYVVEIAIEFVNENELNPRPIFIEVRLVKPDRYSPDNNHRWNISSINLAPA